MDEFEKFYNRTLRFLSYRPRSEKEIKDFFIRKKVDPEIAKKILRKLKKLNLVDDREFAKWWIEQRQGSRPRGMRVIKMELKQKGVADNIIETIIHDSKFMIQTEEELAMRVLEKKLKTWQGLPQEKFREKIIDYLLRRGFDWETIKKVIDEF